MAPSPSPWSWRTAAITEGDLAEVGTALKFCNPDAVIRCLEMMAYRGGRFGDLLAEGGYRLAEHYRMLAYESAKR